MLNSHERHLALSYLANMLARLRRKRRTCWSGWRTTPRRSPAGARTGERIANAASNAAESPANWRALRRLVDKARLAASDAAPDLMGRRLRRLGETVGLSSLDIDVLEVLLRYGTQPVVESLIDAAFLHMGGSRMPMNARGGALSCVLGKSVNAVADRFAADAPLVRTGLVSIDQDQDVQAIGRLRCLDAPDPEEVDVRRFLLGAGGASELVWSDFEHLGQSREDVLRLLRGAVDRGARGVNILVYGPPGTGKTEFCRVLASKAGLDLFGVGEADDKGNEPSRKERLAELRLAQCLLGEDSGGVLLFDEMEDLLSGSTFPWSLFGSRRRGGESKVFMNRLLEETPAPTFWTTNIAEGIDPAILRRMTFALEMRQPSTNVRARVWQRQLSSHGIQATPAQTLALAREFDASPGVAAGATAAAALADGHFELVRRGVRSLSRVLGCDRPALRGANRFDPTLLSADIDLTEVAARLADRGERRFSLCLQGPPGTGKSAYARYLAERMGLEVVQRRASDLLDKYVGETEKHIAEAFAQARADEAFLVFDEADSLLADRRGAERNWEISQVNEMLTWMESHPLPFACTTNYADKLDEAVLRRFTFKVTLGYLGQRSARSAFLAYFGMEAPSRLDRLDCLAPGDFEVVRRKAEVMGQLDDAHALVEMLRAECAAKPGRKAAIGFGAP